MNGYDGIYNGYIQAYIHDLGMFENYRSTRHHGSFSRKWKVSDHWSLGCHILISNCPFFEVQTWTLCARWRYCMLEGWHFFWKTLDMKDLSDSSKTPSKFLQRFPRPFPNLSRKDLGNHLSCEAAATATRMQLEPLEKDTWSLRWSAQGEDTPTNRWCSYPHFGAMKINRDNVPVFVAGGQKIPEHLQF